MNVQWFIILNTIAAIVTLLSFVLLGLRVQAKYTYREIEDIVIYDYNLKQKLDYDSPAILCVYYNELRRYEDQNKYYTQSKSTRNASILQRIRKVFNKFGTP